MYRLTLLHPDTLKLFEYQGNPWTDTIPNLVDMLENILAEDKSESTVRRSLTASESYTYSGLNSVGVPIVAIIANLPK
jgi:hypothetical protein